VLLSWWGGESPALVTERRRAEEVLRDDGAQDAYVAEWHARMRAPLRPGVKYAAALRRILGEDGCWYHASTYKDTHAFAGASPGTLPAVLESLDIGELHQERKQEFWSIVQQMNAHAFGYYAYTLHVPTHEEIRDNIRMHKATRAPPKPAVLAGFDATYDELMARLDAPSEEGDRVGSWSAVVREVRAAAAERDLEALRAVRFAHDGTCQAFARAEQLDERGWELVEKLNSFAGVQGGIPANMMSRIESTAHRIAGEIACGKTDLGSLNLAQLGQSVLEGCDVADVQQLANGMGSLLPMLSGLQRSMDLGGAGSGRVSGEGSR
jgi:hypothetical protein